MKKTKISSLSFGILIAVVVQSNGNNYHFIFKLKARNSQFSIFTGAGNGCAWSGCQHFAFTTCLTEATGVQGRVNRIKHKGCEIIGRKDYCCDEDCGYQACGVTCEHVGMADFSHDVSSLHCDNKFGVKSTKMQHFCCGKRSARPNNGFGDLSDNVEGDGSGFRTSSNNGGFRSSQSNDSSTQDSTNNVGGEGSGFRTSSNNNGGFRGSASTDPNNRGTLGFRN